MVKEINNDKQEYLSIERMQEFAKEQELGRAWYSDRGGMEFKIAGALPMPESYKNCLDTAKKLIAYTDLTAKHNKHLCEDASLRMKYLEPLTPGSSGMSPQDSIRVIADRLTKESQLEVISKLIDKSRKLTETFEK